MTKGTRFTADYEIGCYKERIGGYRSEWVHATLIATSDKMAVVEKAEMEQAGSNRQKYFVAYYEKKEIGKKKRIGCLYNVTEIA